MQYLLVAITAGALGLIHSPGQGIEAAGPINPHARKTSASGSTGLPNVELTPVKLPAAPPDSKLTNPIDVLLAAHLRSEKVDLIHVVPDRVFARRVFLDLIGLLLQTETEQKELVEGRRYSPARLNLLKAEVLQNLTRSTLTIDRIAQANGLSARQAQRLFAQSGVTFTEFVLEQRLSLAHRILVDPQNRYRKISDIAYSVGFGDLSYFNRAFRSRFGIPPSDMRGETDLHLN